MAVKSVSKWLSGEIEFNLNACVKDYALNEEDIIKAKDTIKGIFTPFYGNSKYNYMFNSFYKSMLYKILSSEPYAKYTKVERTFYGNLLNGVSQNTIYNPLDEGLIGELFYNYCVDVYCIEVTKKIDLEKHKSISMNWLSDWLYKWRGKDNSYYPVLFKKIVYYYIILYNITNEELVSSISLSSGKNLLNKWNIYSVYKEDALSHKHTSLPIKRNGLKQAYLTKFIQEVYYEAYRQKVNSMLCKPTSITSYKEYGAKKKDLFKFVDIFGGTGTVAASMNVVSSKKILNEIDSAIMSALFILAKYPHEFQKKFEEFNLAVICGDFESKIRKIYTKSHDIEDSKEGKNGNAGANGRAGLWYYDSSTVNTIKNFEKMTEEERDLIVKIRNAWLYCEAIFRDMKTTHNSVDYDELGKLKSSILINNSIDFENLFANSAVFDKVLTLAVYFIYYQFLIKKSNMKNGHHNVIDIKSYYKMLSRFYDLNYDEKYLANLLVNTYSFKYKQNILEDWRKSLKDCIFKNLDFRQMFIYDEAFYYLDSPYFGTAQYNAVFSDDNHKDMLDILRTFNNPYLFSMQYYISEAKDGLKNRLQYSNCAIKDYSSYLKGFLTPFKAVATENSKPIYSASISISNKYDGILEEYITGNREFDSLYNSTRGIQYSVYAILYEIGADNKSSDNYGEVDEFDEDNLYVDEAIIAKEKNNQVKREKSREEAIEMYVTNIDCSRILPYGSDMVQLPLEELIRCVDEKMKYKDIVHYAKLLRGLEIKSTI